MHCINAYKEGSGLPDSSQFFRFILSSMMHILWWKKMSFICQIRRVYAVMRVEMHTRISGGILTYTWWEVRCGSYAQSEITGGPAYMSEIHERQKDKKRRIIKRKIVIIFNWCQDKLKQTFKCCRLGLLQYSRSKNSPQNI